MKTIFTTLLFCLFLSGLGVNPVSAQKGKTDALETIGAAGGLLLYDSYVVVGALGDAFEKEVYDAGYIKELMTEQVNSIEAQEAQFKKLSESGFLEETGDKDFIKEMITCFGLLKAYAKSLISYSSNVNTENADIFQADRKKAWDKVTELLGLDK